MQTTSKVLMVRPLSFGFNDQTASSNAFQEKLSEDGESVQDRALREFDQMVSHLRDEQIEVHIVKDTFLPPKPDAVFPNNWISTHENGRIYIFPMHAPNRRFEKRSDIIQKLKTDFKVNEVIDLSYFEKNDQFLEGTGSMVLDRVNKIAYACLSARTDQEVLYEFCRLSGYQALAFHAQDEAGKAIYHTNVMMCVGESFAVVCLEAIEDDYEKALVIESLENTGKQIIEITRNQMNSFPGNMLQLKNKVGADLLVMSSSAFQALSIAQKHTLEKYCRIVNIAIPTIEKIGGGSVRCMLAEVYI
jgi:hypothetical protein